MGNPASTSPCPGCGAPAVAGASYCSRCGTAINPTTPPAPTRPRWYYNVWFVLFMLFFVLGPFGLPLVWKNPSFSRPIKLVLSLIMVLYVVLLVDLSIRIFRVVTNQLDQFQTLLY
jgi:hypothetical protein